MASFTNAPYVECKLMQSNRPPAKFLFELDLKRLIVNSLNPISAVQFTRRDNLIQIWTTNKSQNSIYIENELKKIEIVKAFSMGF